MDPFGYTNGVKDIAQYTIIAQTQYDPKTITDENNPTKTINSFTKKCLICENECSYQYYGVQSCEGLFYL